MVALLVLGCSGPRLATVGAKRFSPAMGEERLWALAGQDDERQERAGALLREPAVEQYLEGVARRLVPPEMAGPLHLKVRILKEGAPRVFARANGTVYISAGMLADLQNEAQLATVLAHDLSHVLLRHAYRDWRAAGENTVLLTFTLGMGKKPILAALAHYSRDQERAADANALRLVLDAGYDPGEVVRLFVYLNEIAKEEEPAGSLDAHPDGEERTALARAAALVHPNPGTDVGSERFLQGVQLILLRAGRLDLAMARYAGAEKAARDLLSVAPPDALAWALLGDAARVGGRGLPEAVERYQHALAIDPACAEAWRGLGRALHRRGDIAGSRAALERYLRVRPEAVDRALIEGELRSLGTPAAAGGASSTPPAAPGDAPRRRTREFEVELPADWLRGSTEHFDMTRQGFGLQWLRVLKLDMKPFQGLLPEERGELFAAIMAGLPNAEIREVRPATLSGAPGFVVTVRYREPDEPQYTRVAACAPVGEVQWCVEYTAPTRHYFELDLPTFERAVVTFQVKPSAPAPAL
jgi:tetratricopeptide (TPR) repeat protein